MFVVGVRGLSGVVVPRLDVQAARDLAREWRIDRDLVRAAAAGCVFWRAEENNLVLNGDRVEESVRIGLLERD